ncbi:MULTISPECIES: hypothetical protein [unclassified Frigoribacterium]|uniref:hypothetical protein n=1 Tax=unclassified Frigoribacterium TaxID=2627005 RepID=UPI001563C9AB|nr:MULTISPECIES: hypothetical protein [unclassified Frigoribacterium]NQW87847.1 hypothetical protein [Frigoribacterium sp. VKM Ac-2860]NQX09344.1 hypothetical protein [Frigoribacterium sp. VKM Ac-2859]
MDEDGRRLWGLGDEHAPDPDEEIVVDDDEAAAEAALRRRSVGAAVGLVFLGLVVAVVAVGVVLPLLLWPVGLWIGLQRQPAEIASLWWFVD